MEPNQSQNTTTTLVEPDAATKNRIENLATVGTALAEWSNGTRFDSNIIAAKEALKAFKEGIDKLSLSPQSKVGMDNLVNLLNQQLEEKLNDTFKTPQANF
jgi:uncharacterized protein (DUF342 family)